MSINIDNFILEYDNFLSPQECKKYINCFSRYEAVGLTISRQKMGESPIVKSDEQLFVTSLLSNNEFNISDTDLFKYVNDRFWEKIYPIYRQKYGILSIIDKHVTRIMKIQKTNKGEGFHVWHCEDGDPGVMRRLMVYILYLNDIEEGGETEFLYYSKRIKAKAGKLILWPAGFTHTHRGNPPLSDTKYILTGWVEIA